jgi:glyoxylase-like metal-dependent hydrolase (beta-lactamase superfamily II)
LSNLKNVTELAPGVEMIACGGVGPQVNVFLLDTDEGLVMVDTSWLNHVSTILDGLRALQREPDEVAIILVTHPHPDHAGGAAGLKQLTGALVAAHEQAAPHLEGRPLLPRYPRPILTQAIRWLGRSQGVTYPADTKLWWPPPVQVDRRLRDGDRVGEWLVIHSPGHAPGNISLYSPQQKVLIAGNWVAGAAGRAPPGTFAGAALRIARFLIGPLMDLEQAAASAHELTALDWQTLLLSHQDPSRFPAVARQLREWAASKSE